MTPAITLYTKPACVQCIQTKKILEREGFDFHEIDITQNPDALSKVKELGYLQAPVVVTSNEHWSGFRPDKILAL